MLEYEYRSSTISSKIFRQKGFASTSVEILINYAF